MRSANQKWKMQRNGSSARVSLEDVPGAKFDSFHPSIPPGHYQYGHVTKSRDGKIVLPTGSKNIVEMEDVQFLIFDFPTPRHRRWRRCTSATSSA